MKHSQQQLDLLEARARRADPATSHKAAAIANAAGKPARQAQVILDVLRQFPPGLTSAEIAANSQAWDRADRERGPGVAACGWAGRGLDRYQVARILRNMERAGLVRVGATRRCAVVGSDCLTWSFYGGSSGEPGAGA